MKRSMTWLATTLLVVMCWACAPVAGRSGSEAVPEGFPDPPLPGVYSLVSLAPLAGSTEVTRDYPDALAECQSSAMSWLTSERSFQRLELSGRAPLDPGAIRVTATVDDMRIVSGGARLWGGAFAGSSYMNLTVIFTDPVTGQVLREKKLSTTNNAFAAEWVGGANDRSLPSDMGRILAEYIIATVPTH